MERFKGAVLLFQICICIEIKMERFRYAIVLMID